ncbi:MAG TPA: hypothetical protein VJ998_00905 [Pseudomonadales bacterium]|nr:hypothetical protein [Pseudomonadales bacterium]
MNKAMVVLLLSFLALAGGCSGGNAPEGTAATPAETPAAAPEKTDSSDNLLSTQQQALKDAGGVQAILDKDAEKKKKALENVN